MPCNENAGFLPVKLKVHIIIRQQGHRHGTVNVLTYHTSWINRFNGTPNPPTCLAFMFLRDIYTKKNNYTAKMAEQGEVCGSEKLCHLSTCTPHKNTRISLQELQCPSIYIKYVLNNHGSRSKGSIVNMVNIM